MNLDENQIKLYDYNTELTDNKAAICLVAGAGAGKTNTIIQKIIKMITIDKCNPKHFFITTFTRAAAQELKLRLTKQLGESTVNDMVIGTFHKIANTYLTKYKITDEIIISSFDESLYLYADLLLSDNYDEDHLYIFIDEYQDINEIQEQIIQNLYSRAKLLVVIGDDQQNIYTFRKSNISYMLNFVEKYNGQYILLTKNYRCPSPVVLLSNTILQQNKNKIDKNFTSASNIDNKIILLPVKCSEYDIQYNYFHISKMIFKKISYLLQIKENDHPSTIVIVSRYNDILKYIETYLISKGVRPYYLENNNGPVIHNKVILSTIHSTKGLEFDHEIFIDFIPDRCTNVIELEEERRLYYVAITRSKIELTIIYNQHKPSLFLRECWFAADQFINLPDNYEKYLLDYNFSKKKINPKYNLTDICNDLTYEQIQELNTIYGFKQMIYKSNGRIKSDNLHSSVNISFNESQQIVSGCDHLHNVILKNYILRQMYVNRGMDILIFEPIQCLLYDNISLALNLTLETYDIFVTKFKHVYDIDFSQFKDKDKFIRIIKKCAAHCMRAFNQKNMIWNNINNKNKYSNSYNNYITNKATIEDIINVSVLEEMVNNTRLSLQYLNITDEHIENTANEFTKLDSFICLLADYGGDQIEINDVYIHKEYSIKINIRVNDSIYIFCNSEIPDYTDLIKLLVYKCISNNINHINIYVPMSGVIYKMENISINEEIRRQFLEKIIDL
jgi:hypothetical protein